MKILQGPRFLGFTTSNSLSLHSRSTISGSCAFFNRIGSIIAPQVIVLVSISDSLYRLLCFSHFYGYSINFPNEELLPTPFRYMQFPEALIHINFLYKTYILPLACMFLSISLNPALYSGVSNKRVPRLLMSGEFSFPPRCLLTPPLLNFTNRSRSDHADNYITF